MADIAIPGRTLTCEAGDSHEGQCIAHIPATWPEGMRVTVRWIGPCSALSGAPRDVEDERAPPS